MAVRRVTTVYNYIGESTDTKPTSPTPPAGSTFHEIDTGKVYLWDGDEWRQDVSCIYCIYQGMIGMPSES